MIVLVDERDIVKQGYVAGFKKEGVSTIGLDPDDFEGWVQTVAQDELKAVDAFLLGTFDDRQKFPELIRGRSNAPVIAMNDTGGLEQTLDMFRAGADDVVRKPAHVREILARVAAVVRRSLVAETDPAELERDLIVYFDGRCPMVKGVELQLPRREQRILEHLAKNLGRRITKRQLFDAVYGLFDENIDECVIEAHTSKLRKKLRNQLGYDPIDAKRYLGYRLAPTGQPDASYQCSN